MTEHNETPPRVSPDSLARALRTLGVHADVEARDRLAVVIPSSGVAVERLAHDATRRQAVALAKREGFTHLALEIRPLARAPLSRD